MRPCYPQLVRLQEVNAETIRAQKLLELMLEQQYLLKPPASSSEPHDAQGGKAVPAEENSKPMPSVEALLSMVSDAVLKKQVHLLKVCNYACSSVLLSSIAHIRLYCIGGPRDQ